MRRCLYDPKTGDLGVIGDGLTLVFALDGVVVDSMPVHTEARQVYRSPLGVASEDIETRMQECWNAVMVADSTGGGLPAGSVLEHGPQNEAGVNFVLDGAPLRRYFNVVVTGTQVQSPERGPGVYLRTADKLGVEPVNCIVFGGSPAGAEAARAAGARAVSVETYRALEGVHVRVPDFTGQVLDRWLAAQIAYR